MKKAILFIILSLMSRPLSAAVEYDASVPQVAFAAQELKDALKEAGQGHLQVALKIEPDAASPEAFQIRSVGPTQVEVVGSDATGAMYGGSVFRSKIRNACRL